jgi:hypothetical protein
MNRRIMLQFCALLLMTPALASAGAYNAAVTGHVTTIQQIGLTTGYTNETIQFTLDTQPIVNCGSGFQRFIFSPTSVPDASMRKNFLAMLLMAKATETPPSLWDMTATPPHATKECHSCTGSRFSRSKLSERGHPRSI